MHMHEQSSVVMILTIDLLTLLTSHFRGAKSVYYMADFEFYQLMYIGVNVQTHGAWLPPWLAVHYIRSKVSLCCIPYDVC